MVKVVVGGSGGLLLLLLDVKLDVGDEEEVDIGGLVGGVGEKEVESGKRDEMDEKELVGSDGGSLLLLVDVELGVGSDEDVDSGVSLANVDEGEVESSERDEVDEKELDGGSLLLLADVELGVGGVGGDEDGGSLTDVKEEEVESGRRDEVDVLGPANEDELLAPPVSLDEVNNADEVELSPVGSYDTKDYTNNTRSNEHQSQRGSKRQKRNRAEVVSRVTLGKEKKRFRELPLN